MLRKQPGQPALPAGPNQPLASLLSHARFSSFKYTLKKFIMFTACSDCRLFGAFIIHLCSLAGKKKCSVLNPLLPWSFLVQDAWSFVIYVMGGHTSFVAFSFCTPFRTFFNASKSLLLYFFLKNISFISLLNHKTTQSIE